MFTRVYFQSSSVLRNSDKAETDSRVFLTNQKKVDSV